MADESLRLQAEVVDKFSAPLKKLRDQLGSVRRPGEIQRITDGLNDIKASADRAANALKSGLGAAMAGIGFGALGVTAGITGAVAALKTFGSSTAEVKRLSDEIGLSVNRLRELQAVGQRFNIAPDVTAGGLKKFSDELYDLKRRRGQVYEELLKSGPGGRELAEKLVGSKSVEEAVSHVLSMLERLNNPAQRGRFAELMFGNRDFGRLGSGGIGSIGRILQEVRKDIGELGPEAVAAAEKFEKAWVGLSQILEKFRNEFGAQFLPEVTKGLEKLSDYLRGSEFKTFMDDLGRTLRGVDWNAFGSAGKTFLKELALFVKELSDAIKSISGFLADPLGQLKKEFSAGAAANAAKQIPGLESKRADYEKRLEEARKKGDKAGEIAAQARLDAIVAELKKLNDTINAAKTGVAGEAPGPTGFASPIQRASFNPGGGSFWRRPSGMGGGGSGGGSVAASGDGVSAAVAPFKGGGSTFAQKAPSIMDRLMKDFGLTRDQAAGVVGNLGHESAGFKAYQEGKPLIPGSRGGAGWAQWTGPRRRAFEKWASERGLDPRSDEANYGFLAHELQTTHKGALAAVRRSRSADEAMRNFGIEFESGRDPRWHSAWGSRQKWTQRALDAHAAKRPGDELMSRGFGGGKVEGNAKVQIDLNGFPKGTRVTPQADGMFKEIQLNRGRQMEGVDV